jgi:hypothetical protein
MKVKKYYPDPRIEQLVLGQPNGTTYPPLQCRIVSQLRAIYGLVSVLLMHGRIPSSMDGRIVSGMA